MDPKIGRYIVNGSHESVRLQELLDGFIKNFVLCEQCDNPETLLVIIINIEMAGQDVLQDVLLFAPSPTYSN